MESRLKKPWIHKVGYRMWSVDVPDHDGDMWWADGETHEDALLRLEEYYHWKKTGEMP